MRTRRDFLLSAGAAATSLSVLVGPANASHLESQPDNVTISYDQARLHEYRPLLDIDPEDKEKLIGLYGWIASSPDYSTDVLVYWASYTHQDAPWWAPETGHYGDHEPVHVEVDSDTGEVKRIRASIYHWIKGEVTADVAPLGGQNGNNPRLRVVNPHHQYTAADPDAVVESFEVGDLGKKYQNWLDNGLEKALLEGASTNPWLMRSEPDFWADGEFGIPSTEQVQARTAKKIGFGITGSLEV